MKTTIADKAAGAALISALSDLVIIFDSAGRLIYANDSANRQLGLAGKKAASLNMRDLIAPPYNGLLPDRVKKLRAEGELMVTTAYNRPGGILPVEARYMVTSIGGDKCVLCLAKPLPRGKKTDLALLEVRERYRRLVEGLKGEYFLYQRAPGGDFTYISPSVQDVLGYDPDHFLKHHTDYLAAPRKIGQQENPAGGGPRPNRLQVRHKDGSRRWLEVLEVPVHDDLGEVSAVEGIAHDITGLVKAQYGLENYKANLERTVEERTAELKAIFERTPLLLLLLDEKFNVLRANTSAGTAKLTGDALKCVNAPGGRCGSSPGCTACVIRKALASTLATGNPVTRAETLLLTENGRTVHLLVSTDLIQTGRTRQLLLCLDDVTTQKEAEASLRKAESFRRLLLSSVGDGIIGVDAVGAVLFMNEAAQAMLGWTFEELKNMPLHAAIHSRRPDGSNYPQQDCPMYAAYAAGKESVVHNEMLWRRDGSGFYTRYSARPMYSGGELAGAVVAFSDMTERRELEKMKDFLTHTIVHDLKNPLLAIMLAGQMLAEDLSKKLTKSQRLSLDILNQQAIEMQDMIANILEIGRIEDGNVPIKPAPYEAIKLLKDAAGALKLIADKEGKSIKIAGPALRAEINGDPELLKRITQNLIGNAIKFSPAGLAVEAGVRASEDEGMAEFFVRDHGQGIPPEYHTKIFEKFFQLDNPDLRKWAGKGLGLAFCKLAVEAHGGRIWVESEPGKGSVFKFTIPLAARRS